MPLFRLFPRYRKPSLGELLGSSQAKRNVSRKYKLHIMRDRKPGTVSLALSVQPGTVSRRVRAAARDDVQAASNRLNPYGLRVARDGESAVVVRDTWRTSGRRGSALKGWEKVDVLGVNGVTSEPATFEVTCR